MAIPGYTVHVKVNITIFIDSIYLVQVLRVWLLILMSSSGEKKSWRQHGVKVRLYSLGLAWFMYAILARPFKSLFGKQFMATSSSQHVMQIVLENNKVSFFQSPFTLNLIHIFMMAAVKCVKRSLIRANNSVHRLVRKLTFNLQIRNK